MDALKTIILTSSLLLMGCGANTSIGNIELEKPNSALGKPIEGVVTKTEGTDLNLSGITKSATLLIFAQETCTTCAKEARLISEKISQLGKLPENVEIVTYMVGLTGEFAIEDAIAWKKLHNVQWSVVVQKGNDNLFQKYFQGSNIVPSILVEVDGKIIYQHSGESSLETLMEKTGEWK